MTMIDTRNPGRPAERDRRRDATSGRSRGESEASIQSTAKAYRMKAGAPPDDALNILHGSTIGVLHRRWQACKSDPSALSADQYIAAQKYIHVILRHAGIMGLPLPHPRSPGAGATRPEPDQETIFEVRRQFSDMRRTLLDCGATLGVGSRINEAVYRICIEDRPLELLVSGEIAFLRVGLNSLARLLR